MIVLGMWWLLWSVVLRIVLLEKCISRVVKQVSTVQ